MTKTSVGSLEHFARLIHPIDPDEFVERYYEQRPLYVRRNDPTYFADVLTPGDLDGLFRSSGLARSQFRMTKESKDIHADLFSERSNQLPTDRLSAEKVLEYFEAGYTIIVNGAYRLFPALDRFCSHLENQLRFPVQANIYITPFSAQGFLTHYDEHDVFVVQVMGSKNWRVYQSPVELPSLRQSWNRGDHTPEAPELDITLSPGDTLYIPRGFLHDADTSGGTTSAHLTLGCHPTYRFDLVQDVAKMADETPALRRSIPLGLLADRAREIATVRQLLKDLVDTVDLDQLLERRDRAFVDNRRIDVRGRFTDLALLNQLNLNSVVRRRTTVLYVIERDEKSVTVRFGGKTVPVQPFLESALESILGEEPFAVRDINGFLTDTARLDLARRFVQAGLLEVVELNAD